MARTITPFRLRTELSIDGAKHTSGFKKGESEVKHYTDEVVKEGKRAAKAFDGGQIGSKFGKDFGASAVASIAGSFSVSTLGGLIGTAVAPGIGTAIGSAIGGGVDKAISTVAPMILSTISSGIELNKLLEDTRVEFKATVGSEQEANKYLKELLGISKDLGVLPATVIETSEKLSDLTGDLKLTRTLLKAAADQAADFGGSVETFQKIADTLGLIAEKGELGSRELQKLFRLGIDAKKRLAEATGLQEKEIDRLMKAGRLRGDVAARLIAESIEREKGGLAAWKTSQTVSGRERQFGVLTQLRAAEGTQEATRAIGDFYEKANQILDSPQAKAFTDFVNTWSGKLITFTEGALKTGVSIGANVAEGLLNFNPATMMSSFTKLGDFVTKGLTTVFDIRSPSHLIEKEIGIPMGLGLASGMTIGFEQAISGEAGDSILQSLRRRFLGGGDIKSTLEDLLKDPKIQSFLDLISVSETGKVRSQSTGRLFGPLGSTDPSKYFSLTGGWAGMRVFSPSLHKQVYTSPLGGGQIVKSTARDFSLQTGLNVRMDQHGQDLIMTWLIGRTPGALEAIKRGDIAGAMKLLGGTWESFQTYNRPGTASASKLISEFTGGKPITDTNPMPVRVMNPGTGDFAAQNLAAYKAQTSNFGGEPRPSRGASMANAQKQLDKVYQSTIEETVKVIGTTEQLTTLRAQDTMATTISMRALIPLVQAEKYHADTSIALTKEYQQAAQQELIKGLSIVDQIAGALGQVAGMMPSQQVGKKRGLFSKILGIAAPFLSFIPGVGPILSQIAGIASNALGGNWSGVVSGIAGGFSTGGVFRGSTAPRGNPAPNTVHGRAGRAQGGPVYGGTPYWVGEQSPELFVPNQSGQIYNQSQLEGGGAQLTTVLTQLTAAVTRLESMPADEVVRLGWRGLTNAMDRNAGVSEQMGRRLQLA